MKYLNISCNGLLESLLMYALIPSEMLRTISLWHDFVIQWGSAGYHDRVDECAAILFLTIRKKDYHDIFLVKGFDYGKGLFLIHCYSPHEQ